MFQEIREFLIPIYHVLDPFFLIYFSLINLVYTILTVIGAVGTFKRIREINSEDFTSVLKSNSLPEITFIVPTYNDSLRILSCVDNLIRLTYRSKRIIFVNDGSTDDTFKVLFKNLDLKPYPIFFDRILPSKPIRGVYRSAIFPTIIVIDKENGEKFDAVNAALNACQTAYFVLMDSDTFIEDTDFEALIRPILSSPETIAVGGAVKIKNGCDVEWNRINTTFFPRDFVSGIQAVEYLRSFLMRVGFDSIGCNYIISGAFGCFHRDIVIKSGGYGPTIANDLEITLKLDRIMRATNTPYQIKYLPDPVAWTETPKTWEELADQRLRWHRGLLESLWFHKSVLFNPKYGLQGFFVHPFLWIAEALEPLVEILGYFYILIGWFFLIINPFFVFAFVLITIGFLFVKTIFCLLMEEFSFRKYPSLRSILKLSVYGFIEFFGYRQLTLIWRAKGFFSFFKKYPKIKEDTKKLNSSIDKIVEQGRLQ